MLLHSTLQVSVIQLKSDVIILHCIPCKFVLLQLHHYYLQLEESVQLQYSYSLEHLRKLDTLC